MITRYEEKTDSLFICINSDTKPVYLEHFFTEEERATELTRKATIEKLMGELKVKEDEYVEPEQAVSKVEEARAFLLTNKDEKNAELLIRTESEKRGWDLNDSDIKIVQESMVDEPSIARTINRWVDTIKEIQNEHDQYEKEEADVEKMKDILTEQLIGEKEIATDGSLQDLGWRNKRILNEALKAIYKGNEDYIN
jgi:nicotinamide mononucleotide adenylyltransferase